MDETPTPLTESDLNHLEKYAESTLAFDGDVPDSTAMEVKPRAILSLIAEVRAARVPAAMVVPPLSSLSEDEQHRIDVMLSRIRSGESCHEMAMLGALTMLESALEAPPEARAPRPFRLGVSALGGPTPLPEGHVWREDRPNPYGVDAPSPAATPADAPTTANLYEDT